MVCNVSDAVIAANTRANSLRKQHEQWIKLEDPHQGTAVLIGSGPSVKDEVAKLLWWRDQGATLYALNNAANWLATHEITPDYQVIMDARPQTAELIGPAKTHLFASQVDPSLFDLKPTARLFHPAYPELDTYLPPYNKSYCLIGGGTTVGLSALCLAFAMGYRKLQLFGYDSCHQATTSHVLPQALNDGELWGTLQWRGTTYRGSLTMLRQAELFQPIANNLIDRGCTITVNGSGLIPDIANQGAQTYMTEKEKYRRMWEFEQYREHAPGERVIDRFLAVIAPYAQDASLIDFGCGTGRAALELSTRGFSVLLTDFVTNSRDQSAQRLPFELIDLYEPIKLKARYGYCTDVMEHLETSKVDAVIAHIMDCVPQCFFQIAHTEDGMGVLIDQILHLTVKPFAWWLDKFCALGYALRHAHTDGGTSTFLVTHSTT